ncbi:MAG TPA: hypothetical protein VHK63_07475 [Candidatus Limnocylindria bacterium]|nr:hypothetical protein [Candidatus Limnocylindria bacterium]
MRADARPIVAGALVARALVAAGSVLALSLAAPSPIVAHAIGQVFTLPVPLPLYLAGAGLAVAASFVVSVVVVRPAGPAPAYPVRPLPQPAAHAASVLLQVVGLAWWLGAILSGYLVDPISPLPAVLFWIGVWVGLPIAAVLMGNPWPSLSPFRSLFGLLEGGSRLAGARGLEPPLAYPRELGRWPAVVLLLVAVWCELILPDGSAPPTIANLLVGYTLLTLAGMAAFGRVAWLRNAELFEVLLGWFGRVGPVGRRVADRDVCSGCGEGCDPRRCVDCPECIAAAEPGELRAELRPWFTGLTEVREAGWSDAAFIVLALAAVTYDGLQVTSFWGAVMQPVFVVAFDLLGALNAVLAVQTGGLLAVWLVFFAAFAIAVRLTQALHDAGRHAPALGSRVGAYATTLLPIAGGYLLAHYLTYVVQGAIWLPGLLADPLLAVAPPLDWIPTAAIWYLSVGAIVLGHVVAVVLAHRLALRGSSRSMLAGLPLVLLMVGYTVLSLWIIAQPLTVDPGNQPLT